MRNERDNAASLIHEIDADLAGTHGFYWRAGKAARHPGGAQHLAQPPRRADALNMFFGPNLQYLIMEDVLVSK